jgi:hypothetical protein
MVATVTGTLAAYLGGFADQQDAATIQRASGTYNDGYADNVSLTLAGPAVNPQPSPAPTATPTPVVAKGVVSVRDEVKRRTVVVRAGKRYVASPRR